MHSGITGLTFSNSSETALAMSFFCSKTSSSIILGTDARTTAQQIRGFKELGLEQDPCRTPVILVPKQFFYELDGYLSNMFIDLFQAV